MPRKTKSSSVTEKPESVRQPYLLPNDSPWGGFINIRLDETQHEEFFAWEADNSQHVWGYFGEILGAGCKASFSFDAENECFICAITGALMGSTPGSRFCSTSRAATMEQVLALTVWKHVVLAKGDYGNYRPKGGSFMSFG